MPMIALLVSNMIQFDLLSCENEDGESGKNWTEFNNKGGSNFKWKISNVMDGLQLAVKR